MFAVTLAVARAVRRALSVQCVTIVQAMGTQKKMAKRKHIIKELKAVRVWGASLLSVPIKGLRLTQNKDDGPEFTCVWKRSVRKNWICTDNYVISYTILTNDSTSLTAESENPEYAFWKWLPEK